MSKEWLPRLPCSHTYSSYGINYLTSQPTPPSKGIKEAVMYVPQVNKMIDGLVWLTQLGVKKDSLTKVMQLPSCISV